MGACVVCTEGGEGARGGGPAGAGPEGGGGAGATGECPEILEGGGAFLGPEGLGVLSTLHIVPTVPHKEKYLVPDTLA